MSDGRQPGIPFPLDYHVEEVFANIVNLAFSIIATKHSNEPFTSGCLTWLEDGFPKNFTSSVHIVQRPRSLVKWDDRPNYEEAMGKAMDVIVKIRNYALKER